MGYATTPSIFYSGTQNITPPGQPPPGYAPNTFDKNGGLQLGGPAKAPVTPESLGYTFIGNNQWLSKNQQLITGDPNNPNDPLGLNVQRTLQGGGYQGAPVPNTPYTPSPFPVGQVGFTNPQGATFQGFNSGVGGGTPYQPQRPSGGLFGVPWLSMGNSGGAASGTLAGAPPFGYSPSAGGIPQVPNPGASAGQAIGGNIGNLGSLGQLSQGIGSINAGLGQQPYIQNFPGYQGLLNKASANTSDLLRAIVPTDVTNNLAIAGAERGVATGAPGSPNANAAMLRALGLTSLGLQQQGQQNFAQLRGQTPTGPAFNPASMLVDPNMWQQAQAAANLYNAAPNPQAAQNAAFRAMNQGLNRGQGATQPTQSGSLVQDILNRYAPTATGGTPAYPSNVPTGVAGTGQAGSYYAPPPVDYANISDEQLYNLMMGELPQQQAPTDYGNGGYYSDIIDQPTFSDYYDLGGG